MLMRPLSLAGAVLALGLAALPARALDIQPVTSPGGIEFWLVEEPAIPIVAIEMAFEGGARIDPEDKAGVANMVAGLLDEGAGEMDSVAFAKERDRISARYGFSAGRDTMSVSARMLAENAAESAALLATALTEPRFDPAPMERMRGRILSSIAESETDPGSVARKTWFANAFPDHPYGRPVEGRAETVSELTREDLVAATGRLLTRSNVTIGIVGALDAEEAGRLVDTILGDLPEGAPITAEPAPDTPPPGTEVVTLDVPQSAAIFGHHGLRREDPDFIPAFVMNHILGGGGFSSKLTEEVREKRGLAYGVYSYLQVLEAAELHMGGVRTANERMGESLEVIRAQWRRMAEDGPTQERLDDAKKYLTGAFPLRFDSNAKIADYLVFVQRAELGLDYFDRRNDLIEAVTLEDVKRVAARLLKPEELSIVVVGQPAGL
jgi:zinc protease